jgi:neutral ceramidase
MGPMTTTTLRAGFASADITPPLGHPNSLGGARAPILEIWQPLRVGVVALDDPASGARFVAAGLDLCGLLEETHRRIREAIGAAAGVDPELVVANSSHTHSAPYLSSALDRRFRPLGLVNSEPSYVDAVVAAAGRAAAEAVAALKPVGVVRVGHGRVIRVAANRRPKLDGVTIHRWGRPDDPRIPELPEGLTDPDAHLIALDDGSGRLIGSIVVYACHPTSVGGSVHGWLSPDFVGPARDRIEAGTAAPMLFLQGCGGNCGTGKWIAGTPQEDVVAMGGRLADGIESALARATPVEVTGPLRVGALRVDAPLDPATLGTVPDLEAALAAVAAAPEPDISKAHEIGDRLAFVEQVAAGWRPRVVAARVGDLALVSLPGEQFVQHGLRIRESSPMAETIVSAYDDNSLQYVPTAEDFAEGAYEVNGGWRYVAPGGGEAIADGALELLRTLAV